MSRHQIHGDRAFDRVPWSLANPSLRMQFHAPVHYENIQGKHGFSIQLEALVIVWGRSGHCWAYLHDFDARSVRLILDDCRQATYDRRGVSANPFVRREYQS